jgi:CRP/FNR family transcriptional regulator, nitrogen fixation regulation protein
MQLIGTIDDPPITEGPAMTAAPIELPPSHAPAVPVGRGFRVDPPILVASGNEIYAPGGRAGCLYRVEFGAVRLYRLLSDGRRQITAFHLPGEIFGFETGDEHHFFADAICATGLRVLPRPGVSGADATIAAAALHCLVRTQEHLLVVGRQNAAERVAAFLLDMAERQGGLEQFDLPMCRADIGDYLGLTIETVSRIISRLRSQEIIKLVSLRSLRILKLGALKAMTS